MRVTAEQIECANLVNLPEFLENQGFDLKKVGKEYVLTEHDSLHIKDNKFGERGKWFQFSADEGGNNIQFVQKFMGLDFISAVELLSDENAISTKAYYHSEPEVEPSEKREIAVHESKDITRMTSYLHVVRGLSAGSLARLIAEGKLSQEEKTGNAVFKIFDENGLLVGAEKVGTSGGKFKSIEKGSASGYGFEMAKGNPVNAYFFESAIDAVSFADLHPELDNYRLISMAGVKPSVVEETMKRYAVQPENIYICTDNDKAGNKFAEKLIAQYSAMKRVTPQGAKDWNDILQGRVEKMKLYGNTYWQEATDNRDKTVAVMHEDTFRQLQETLDKSGLNYCAYSDGKKAMVAVNSSEVDRFRTVTGLDESLCRLQKSGREHIPQDKNIIGNTNYRYIPQKTYINDDRETILKMAELANKANIQFSARIYPSGKAAMTVSQADMSRVNAIRDNVKAMRKSMIQNSRQASQEIIGNKPYREIRNRNFFVSPLTPEKYHKIEPKLFEHGAEFSGLIRDGKVMFTTEKEQAQRFNAILRQTVSENQILENLQNMGLDSQQIQALSSAIEIASRNNMANIIENYVSKEYDISQLNTMNNLLIAYLDQNDTSRFLDNGRQLDMLLSTKQKFDLQIAQREELASFEEIYNPENDEMPENSLSFHFGDKDSEWFTESDLLYDFVQKNPDMSFALANAIIEYLDEKQHAERNIPELHAGWYKKTDFTVATKINGQEFTHSGRFDIGDGAGTGGGTLIDHIEQFAKGALAQGFPYNSEDDRKSLNYLLDSVVPFLKENAEMTAEEINIFNSFKNDNPIRTFADVEIAEPPSIADFREKTEENFRFYNFKPVEVENIVKDFVQRVFEENGVTAEIGSAAVTGSRSRGLENADSDIDVVIEIDSDLKEDALFNIIHDEELTLEGYTIDINPIKADETGTLETYLPTAETYLAEKAQHMKESEQKSDLPTFDVYIYDRESGANSPMRCQAKNAEEAMKMADEYIKRWKLIEAEITDVQLVEPEKELAKDEPITEKSAETGIADDAPLFDESIIAEAGLGFVPDKELESFGNNEQDYEQLTLFGEPEPINKSAPTQNYIPIQYGESIADVNRFEELHKEIMRGSGFQDGKFRIAEFFQEHNPNNKEFADFLKNEYGTGGHTADDNIFMVDYDSKGMQFTVRSTEGGISEEKFDFSWTEVAKLTADLIRHDKYITQDDIDRKNQREAKTEKSDTEPEIIAVADEKPEPEIKTDEKSQNFTITDDKLGEGGAKTKFRNNLLAIQTLKQIEIENRKATPEEKEIISKYVGWGGLAQAFDSDNEQWGKEWSQLFKALTPKEYDEARRSVLDSFFTSPAIIDSIYEALGNFGFDGGNVLEPAMGVGNFFGRMPEDMQRNSQLYGVEIDSISGRIAQALYPDTDIAVKGFEQNTFQNGCFDVAVGNVPFGDLGFVDSVHGTSKLHDYFFAETLDKLKNGGIMAFVTSAGTLDKRDETTRQMLADKADLIGAIRLPGGKNGAFKDNEGTEVTTDIIFLQKHEGKSVAEMSDIPDWVHIGETADGLPINRYFEQHPDMVLGTVVEGNKLYGSGTMVVAEDGFDLKSALHDAVSKLSATISPEKGRDIYAKTAQGEQVQIPSNLRNYSFFMSDDQVYFKKNNAACEFRFDKGTAQHKRFKAFIELRDLTRELLEAQEIDKSDSAIKALQAKLNASYDDFYRKYGLIHSQTNKRYFSEDVSYNLVAGLEKKYDKTKLVEKSDIFTKRTIVPPKAVDHVETALEALTLSSAEKAGVDFAYMSSLTGMTEDELKHDLQGEIFKVPHTENDYQTASEYLSGDIRKKLREAEEIAEYDADFNVNVSALKAAMPEPLKAGDIDVKIGAAWLDPKYYEQFIYELLQTPEYQRSTSPSARWSRASIIGVEYSEHTNSFHVSNKSSDRSVLATQKYGSHKMNAYDIFEHILNLQEPKVYKTIEVPDDLGDMKEKRVVDIDATRIVQRKADSIRKAFKDWIFKDPVRREAIVQRYNELFNSIRPREYDGSALSFPMMTKEITLHPHQKNAIAHAMFGGNTLFAHSVGAGKTFEMIATAMESKRLGLCTKSLFAVPNHLTEQIGDDFQKLYPSANILVATKKDFKKENRQQLFAKIATGNFDAVIIGHSQLGMIPVSKERQVMTIQSQIDDILQGIAELKRSEGSKFQIKAMERTRKSLQKQLDKLEKANQDDTLTFEQLGVDRLFLDEMHEFKNCAKRCA